MSQESSKGKVMESEELAAEELESEELADENEQSEIGQKVKGRVAIRDITAEVINECRDRGFSKDDTYVFAIASIRALHKYASENSVIRVKTPDGTSIVVRAKPAKNKSEP